MDAKRVLEVLREIEPSADCCPGMYPKHWMGCKLAALIAAIEQEAQEPGENDWQSTVGMFAGDAEMQAISEETRSVREAHKEPGGWKPGTEPPSGTRNVMVCEFDDLELNRDCEHPRMGYYSHEDEIYFVQEYGRVVRVHPDNIQWHDLPPLPEEKP